MHHHQNQCVFVPKYARIVALATVHAVLPANHCSVMTPGSPVLDSYSINSWLAANWPPLTADEKLRIFGLTGTWAAHKLSAKKPIRTCSRQALIGAAILNPSPLTSQPHPLPCWRMRVRIYTGAEGDGYRFSVSPNSTPIRAGSA